MQSLNYDTIVFDLDGTLLDTLDDLTNSVNELLKGQGYSIRDKQEIRSFLGHGAKVLLQKSLPEDLGEEVVDRLLPIYKEIYKKNMNDKTAPYEGIIAMLAVLKSAGVKMAVVSNKPDWACVDLCKNTFDGLIDVAIGDRADIARKPAPDSVYKVLEAMGSDGKRGLYVGDSEVDIRTAKNADLSSVAVCWGFRDRDVLEREGADYVIEHPRELLTLVGI